MIHYKRDHLSDSKSDSQSVSQSVNQSVSQSYLPVLKYQKPKKVSARGAWLMGVRAGL